MTVMTDSDKTKTRLGRGNLSDLPSSLAFSLAILKVKEKL